MINLTIIVQFLLRAGTKNFILLEVLYLCLSLDHFRFFKLLLDDIFNLEGVKIIGI